MIYEKTTNINNYGEKFIKIHEENTIKIYSLKISDTTQLHTVSINRDESTKYNQHNEGIF